MASESTPLLSPSKPLARAPARLFGDALWAPKATYALSNMGISAFCNFLPVLYESTAHFSKLQIGVLQALPCVCTILGAPFWCAIADKFENHRAVHNLSIVTGTVFVYAVSLSRSFTLTLVLILLANFLNAPNAALLDHAVLDLVAKLGGEYGKQRLFASIGYGLGAYFAGVVVVAAGIAWAFNVSVVTSLASMLVLMYIPVPSHHGHEPDPLLDAEHSAYTTRVRSSSFSHAMRQLVKRTDVIVLLIFVFLVGLMYGVLTSFLTLNLYDLSGGNAQIVGIAIMCETASEALAFFYSQSIIDRLGTVNVLLVSVAGYALRITYFAFMANAWSALPFEFLHGLTYGLIWAASTEYLFAAAPRGTESTVMGLLNAVLEGAGRGGGTLIGGYFYQHYGAKTMWLVADLGVPLALVGLAAFAYCKKVQEAQIVEAKVVAIAARPTRARGSALRKRVLGVRASSANAPEDDGTSAVLGSAHANAYFNAKRLKQASGATPGRKRRASATDHKEQEPVVETPPSAVAFTVRPMSETAEILRRVDAREDAWRQASPCHAWPSHHESFTRWATQLRAGFSVLLHGVGSKLSLLQAFADSLPETAYVVHVHGELPSVALRDVIALLQHEVLELPAKDSAHLASLSFVRSQNFLPLD